MGTEFLKYQLRELMKYLFWFVCITLRMALFFCFLIVGAKPGSHSEDEGKKDHGKDDGEPRNPQVSLAFAIFIIAAFTSVVIYKTTLLTVSLPPGRLPPNNRFLQKFFLASPQHVFVH